MCAQQSIALNSGKSSSIDVLFVPMFVGDHEAIVWLCDEQVGEMVVMVVGKSVLPQPLATVQWESVGNEASQQILRVPFVNDAKLAAMSLLPASHRHGDADVSALTITHNTLRSNNVLLDVEYKGSNCFVGPTQLKLVPARPSSTGTLYAPYVRIHSLLQFCCPVWIR
jgi:hypothetical protein